MYPVVLSGSIESMKGLPVSSEANARPVGNPHQNSPVSRTRWRSEPSSGVGVGQLSGAPLQRLADSTSVGPKTDAQVPSSISSLKARVKAISSDVAAMVDRFYDALFPLTHRFMSSPQACLPLDISTNHTGSCMSKSLVVGDEKRELLVHWRPQTSSREIYHFISPFTWNTVHSSYYFGVPIYRAMKEIRRKNR